MVAILERRIARYEFRIMKLASVLYYSMSSKSKPPTASATFAK